MSERFRDPVMQDVIKRTVRSLMAEENITYRQLSAALHIRGINQNESTLRSKISTGVMSSSLFLHLLLALGVSSLDLSQIMKKYEKIKQQE